MILKQIVKNVPIVIKSEVRGGDIKITLVFMGRNTLSLKINKEIFIGIRNFIEEIYQSTLDDYKDPSKAIQDRIERNNPNLTRNADKIFTGYINKPGLGNINTALPRVDNRLVRKQ